MELKENDYILGLWFAADKEGDDWLCHIKKGDKENSWEGTYRFRYIKDAKVFGSEDEKSIVDIKLSNKTEKEVFEDMNQLFEAVKMKYNHYSDFIEVKGDLFKMIELCKDKDWIHIKEETIQ